MTKKLDLIVLVADADAEWAVRTLIEKRTASLQIRPILSKVIRDPGRDSGVRLNAPALLRPLINQSHYALVIFDYEGSGREHRSSAQEMEAKLEEKLHRNGWVDSQKHPRAIAIVLDPELEIWVWSRSPHVAKTLGLSSTTLQQILSDFATTPNGKPERPKEAMLAALWRSKRPHSARIFQELAEQVILKTA